MMQGKGSLSELEELKAEYSPQFKIVVMKRHRINQICFELLCPYAIGRVGMGKSGVLRVKAGTCTRKRCPKDRET